jgi:ubiquitin fusion degradation protein 1
MQFDAPEGHCYIPYWMMQQLFVAEGGILNLKSASLPKATYVKVRPTEKDFLDLVNPRATLELALRKFSCMTAGNQICFPYLNKIYSLDVLEVRPGTAVCIIETNVEVDFAPPPGYEEEMQALKESAAAAKAAAEEAEIPAVPVLSGSGVSAPAATFTDGNQSLKELRDAREARLKRKFTPEPKVVAFSGVGVRVDGKKIVEGLPAVEKTDSAPTRSVGKFEKKKLEAKKPAFTGSGYSLK